MTLKVGMVQINNSFAGQNYLPYSIGLLMGYAQKYLVDKEQYDFLIPIYSRIRVEEIVERMCEADIVFFSTYVWNIQFSLKIAQAIKEKRSETITVFGGPQIPDHSEAFLRMYSFVDLAIHGEGETSICQVMENTRARSWRDVPSISFLDKDDNFRQTHKVQRINNLKEIPSPYLDGVFDPLMAAYPDEKWLVLWETNRGCPFSCAFCDWGSANKSKVYQFDIERLFKEVDWMRAHQIEFVSCCDANFGILKRDKEIVQYVADTKRKYGYPHALSVQNTKNTSERTYQIQKILAEAGLNKGVSLSLQSLDKTILENVKRSNISIDGFQELQHRFTSDSIETYTDLIIGLPGETYDSFLNGVSTVIASGQHNRIQFGNLTILPNSEMGSLEYQRKYGMEIVETKIINMHGSLLKNDEISEKQQLVVATSSMPREDWVETRVFCWMCAFLHFDKMLQIPLIVLHKLGGLSFRELFEAFLNDNTESLPVFTEIRSSFSEIARNIQLGGPEYCHSKKWLNIWWYADELAMINICTENKLDRFYDEAIQIFKNLLREKSVDIPASLIRESIDLNKNLLKLPFHTDDLKVELTYNVWDLYYNARKGVDIPIEENPCQYFIDRTSKTWSSWQQWCREVIWFGNKRGAYLYSVKGDII
jgi:radical SAM superfamily enzyme YgiQ (UPF0313 family)